MLAAARFDAVFFDLDGTLADTAPDLGGALNRVRLEEGLEPLHLDALRRVTSHGVRGLLQVGFALAPGDRGYAALAARVLTHYSAALCVETQLFPGIAELLDLVEANRLRWGIVTNKALRYTVPVVDGLALLRRAASVVGGDSAPRAKPSADPLLLAAAVAGVEPARCHYVGDDARDIHAGLASGMATVAVRYGYLGDGLPIEAWGADHIADHPLEIAGLLGIASARIAP